MTDDLRPAPLTPPDLDVRQCHYMPLEVRRLRDSNLAVLASGDEFRAAVLLWCASWHQIPAASLPNNDRVLINLAAFNGTMRAWNKSKKVILHGFVECSDGRLYHKVIAANALESNDRMQGHRARTAKATEARRLIYEARNDQRNDDRDEQPCVQRNDLVGEERRGEDRKEESSSLRSDGDAAEKKAAAAGKRGTRLGPDWQPAEADVAAAKAEGLSDRDIAKAAAEFRDYWIAVAGAKGVKSDWPATWRNRVRAVAERLGRAPIEGAGVPLTAPLHGEQIGLSHVAADDKRFGRTFLKADSKEWIAWGSHLRGHGEKEPARWWHGGWDFAARWPPGHEQSANKQTNLL